MKGVNLMYDYRGKIMGMVIAALGLVALIANKLTGFTVLEKYDSAQHFNILLFITTFGLFCTMFSKEKMEDERVQFIRMKALLYAFMLTVGAPLAFACTISLDPASFIDTPTMEPADVIELARLLMFYPAIGCTLYLVVFHIGLYADGVWDYEDRPWAPADLLKNWGSRLLLLVISLIILFAAVMLIRM